MANDKPTRTGVQSVERAFELLEIMANAGGTVSLGDLADHADLPPPTIHRLTRTLLALGYVRQLPNRNYTLGPRLIRLGESAGRLLGSWSRPHLHRLVEETGETANMAIMDGDMAAYVAQVPSPHAMRTFTEVGSRVYLHSTGVGKALLMEFSNEAIRALVGRAGMPVVTPTAHSTPESLLRDIELSRQRGYAVDEGEQEVGVRCFAVPVLGVPAPIALSISGPAARVTLKTATKTTTLLKKIARDIAADFAHD